MVWIGYYQPSERMGRSIYHCMKYIVSETQFKLLTEQQVQGKVYTNETDYKKALSKYNKDLLVYNWLKELEGFSKEFSNPNMSVYNYEGVILKKPYGSKISKTFPQHSIAQILEGLNYLFTAWGKNKNQVKGDDVKKAREIYKLLGLDMSKREGRFPILVFQGKTFQLPIYPKPEKPIYKPITPKPIVKPTIDKPKPEVQKPQEPLPQKKQSRPPEGASVFGPGYTLIGTIVGRDFIPIDISEWSGSKLNPANIQDLELLNDKIKLNQFLRLKFGSYINPVK